MAESQIDHLHFSNLARGLAYNAPPRALGNSAGERIYRDSLGLIPRDGALRSMPGYNPLVAHAQNPDHRIGSRDTDIEAPVWVFVGSRAPLGSSATNKNFHAVVTDRQIHVRPSNTAGWKNCTPTYSTGTIAITNGTATVNGTSTLWVTRNITPNQWIELPTGSNDWYQILSVGGEGTITLITNFTGATLGAGSAYTIRRTFIGGGAFDEPGLFHCLIYNENLYVAGSYLGGADGVLRPALIKVADVYSATPTTTYLTSSVALVSGLDTISGLLRIVGVKALQDGRIVFAGNTNEVFWSSNLNDAVWTTAPGGSNPLVETPAALAAVGSIGSQLTFHSAIGITWGRQTFQANEPLAFERSTAEEGVVCPNTLREINGIEVGLARSGNVIAFDGHSTRPVGIPGEMARRLREQSGGFTPGKYAQFHAAYLADRGQYYLFRSGSNAAAGRSYWVCDLADSASWWTGETGNGMVVTAMSDGAEYHSLDTTVQAVVGLPVDGAGEAMLSDLDDDLAPPSFFVETDDVNGTGDPLSNQTPHSLILWAQTAITSVFVSVRRAVDAASGYIAAYAALLFDGASGQVSYGDILNQGASDSFTVETRGRTTPTGTFKMYASKRSGGGVAAGWNFFARTSDTQLTGEIGDGVAAATLTVTDTTHNDAADHMISFVVDRTAQVMRLYNDGVLLGTSSSIAAIGSLTNATALFIGRRGDGFFWSGRQGKEFRFWSVARTTAEIQATYNTELAGDEAGLEILAKYNDHESTPTTLADSSGNGRTGTISGGATWVGTDVAANTPKRFDFLPGAVAQIKASEAHRFRISGSSLVGGLYAMLIRVVKGTLWERES